MKAKKIVFLKFPCREVVCETWESPEAIDPKTHDLREYAQIVPRTAEIGGIWVTQFEFAGQIEWTEHAGMLSDEQRAQIEHHAAMFAEADRGNTEKAKALQKQQRKMYAAQVAKYGEC